MRLPFNRVSMRRPFRRVPRRQPGPQAFHRVTVRQRIVRLTLVGGLTLLALLLLLTTLDVKRKKADTAEERPKKAVSRTVPSIPRLNVPPAYDTTRGWEITGVSPDHAVAVDTDRVAYVERVDDERFRVRTLDATTGERTWDGAPWWPLFPGDRYPRLLSVAKDGEEYFVAWSYGRPDTEERKPPQPLISLDIYKAGDGTRRRVELPWPNAPVVRGSGPGIVVSDGKATSAVVDPATGDVVKAGTGSLGYPKGCENCRKLTEVHGLTDKGLLVGGVREFWVRGGWYSRKTAPKGTDAASGVPASLARGHLLARWQPKKGAKDARTHQVWALHDTANGKAVAQVRCRKPAIVPSEEPQLVASPNGRYLVAGRLAFDLEEKKGYCFEEPDGTDPLTLTTVTNDGVAYGATSARNVTDALTRGGEPVQVDLTTGVPDPLPDNVRLASGEGTSTGLFRWTDAKDVPHLIGYARRGGG